MAFSGLGRYRRLKRVRYAVPAVVLVGVAAGAVLPSVSGAASPPNLPAQSVQQLLVDIEQAKAPALSGTVTWSPNLGLSGLSTLESELGASSPGSTSGFDPLTLLSSSYDIKVWLGGAKEERLALITGQSSEVDVVRNNNQVWLWDSATQQVTHLVGPAAGSSSSTSPSPSAGALPTPQQAASTILSKLSPTTSVTEGQATYVAGQPAYQLVITPREASTVSSINIAVGSSGELAGVPLQVAVHATGVTSPAMELGFTSLSVAAPSASEFSFVAPPGSKVVTHDISGLGQGMTGAGGLGWTPTSLGKSGTGWATVLHGTSSGLAGGMAQAELGAVTTPVKVAGQQARLFSTYLLNVLVMPSGQFYAGFVPPSALETAASRGIAASSGA